ncbi:SDR family oxidoreductase [Nocardia sp. NPDC051570]|uniref:SDR family oxidoreductase n=1 Tax=Nocardia sp. NPDC051570 TaxID=3364324 RepID=UPI0037A61975
MTARTILVTGASGVVGSALLRVLDAQGHRVIALVHHKPVEVESARGDITRPWLGLDPRDYRDLAARVDVVVHCAASVNFGAAPKTLHGLNVAGVGKVLRFVSDARARLVHASSAYVRHADDETVALGAYASSKRQGEILVRESGLPAATARISTVIGDSVTGHIARLQAFHHILGAAMAGLIPFVPREPGMRADLVPADLVAEALAAMATTELTDGMYWITAGEAAVTFDRIIDIAFAVAVQRHRADDTQPNLYVEALKPRIVTPDTYRQVIAMVRANANPDIGLGRLADLDRLIGAQQSARYFPTSLGVLPGSPPPPTESAIEKALIATCRYLASFPKEYWNGR